MTETITTPAGGTKLNGIENRILAYLDQRGGKARRDDIIQDLSRPDSRLGRGIRNGSNSGVPRLMGAWAKRLLKGALIVEVRAGGYYQHHQITDAGRKALRET